MERQLILKEMDIAELKIQKNYCNSTLQGSVPKCQYSAWLHQNILENKTVSQRQRTSTARSGLGFWIWVEIPIIPNI